MKNYIQHYNLNSDGTTTLVSIEEIQVETSTEQLIADKEAQLLEMYQELQALKNTTQL